MPDKSLKADQKKKEIHTLLKQAKKEFKNEDFDECISISKSVLKLDNTSLLALILIGKCLETKKRTDEALKYYVKVSDLHPDSVLGFKGQLSIRCKDSDFQAFFNTLTKLAQLLSSNNDSLKEIVTFIHEYIKFHGLDFVPMKIYYLKQIIPGLSELGDLVGYQVNNPVDSLRALIKTLDEIEKREIKNLKDKIKLTFSINMTESQKNIKYNEKIWPLLSTSEIPQLYELLINLEQNDNNRYKAQDDYLKYKYEMLLSCPGSAKESLRLDIYDMVEGLVLIKCPSEFAWKIYFDWKDPKSLADLELDILVQYIKLFDKSKGYGRVFYNFLISDVSPFEKSKVVNYLKPLKRKDKNKVSDKEIDSDEESNDERYKIFDVQPQEILTELSNALPQVKTSVICCRIIVDYAIHVKDYSLGLDISEQFTRATVLLQNLTGLMVSNSKLAQTLNLAIIYTYYEAPKNFPKALAFYDSISKKDPNNIKVKIGKALILVETKKFEEASNIFFDLIEQDPKNIDAMQEYGWCQLYLNNYTTGREYIKRAIEIFQSDESETKSSNSAEILSTLMYKLALSYFMEFDNSDITLDAATLKSSINECSSCLLKCLKLSPNYAPAYTTLGMIYYKYLNKKDRAIQLFYKAFQLDPAEIDASYKLVEHYTGMNDWEMSDIICRGVIENDRARRQLNSTFGKSNDNSWPYRVLGCAAMECKDDVKAIEYFQTALRMDPYDFSSWLSLGEAYIARGRLEASIKVLTHVIKLKSGVHNSDENITPEMELKAGWHAVYLLAHALTSILEFDKSVRMLINLLQIEENRKNLCILTLLVETLIMRCNSEIRRGAILRASDTLIESFEYLVVAFGLEKKSIKLWKALCDLIEISLGVQSSLYRLPYDQIYDLLKTIEFKDDELLSCINLESYNFEELVSKKKYTTLFHFFFTLSSIGGYLCSKVGDVKNLRSSLLYNIAISLIAWFKDSQNETFRDASIKLLNKAITLESDNADYWNSLGIISLTKNAKISQHCFIKALSLESKNALVWFNLGMLYIKYEDFELANECFIRAQSIAPAAPFSWVGEALVAEEANDMVTSRNLYTHSYVLSKGCNPANTLLYAVSVFDTIMSENHEERDLDATQQLSTANYGLLNYLKLYPNDTFALEINVNIMERLFALDKGIEYSQQLCNLLESQYEERESEDILVNYCKSKCQLSRLYLARKEYENAYEVCEEVGTLLETVSDLSIEVQKCLMSCFTVLGLSLYFQGEFDKSLTEFKKLLEAFPENKRIVVLISQVLYANGDTDAKQAAMDELLNNIETHGTSLIVSMTIAAISLVEEWEDYIMAVKEVLDVLPLDILIRDTYREVPKLLNMISERLHKHSNKAERVEKIWQRNAFLFPGDSIVWDNIDKELSLELNVHAKNKSAMDVADAYVQVKRLRETQRGILLSGGVSEEGLSNLCSLVH
ncbi:Superkiller protein 3 [Pichia californica]|uniref:Superkiller protein 3 n=1 Tax=Pichia californica TaxID=460514 RepID=A0A9P6WQD1_9ASCO|nr:Superkiller protein 3 [[Candida] californica]